MTGLVRKAILLSVCGLLFAGAAMASVPSAQNSTIPLGVRLGGTSAGVTDPLASFSVTVRDIGGNTIANSSVVLDLSGCGPDIRFSTVQPGLTAECISSKSVRVLTNGSGVATMAIAGCSTIGSFSTFLKGKLYADGVLLTDGISKPAGVTVATYDLDGASGVGSGDLSLLATDYFAGNLAGRADLDFNGAVGSGDLSLLAAAYFAGGSPTSAASLCVIP